MRFYNFSLDSLVQFLVKSICCDENFLMNFRNLNDFIARKYNQKCKHAKHILLKDKGVFHNEYFDFYDKLNETLPDQKQFCSSFTQEKIFINEHELVNKSGISFNVN